MTPFALLAASALLFWVNTQSTRQPTKAITFHGAWLLFALALALIILGVPNIGVLL